MEKLELKHLQHYELEGKNCLKFRLSKIGIFNLDSEYQIPIQAHKDLRIINMTILSNRTEIELSTDCGYHFGFLELEEVKPILHPLSEYCGNITGRGVMDKLNCALYTVHEIWALRRGSVALNKISLKTYNVMCRNHIDFSGLIEKGLAIDINTL
jgi:hypothetical protein